jgi:hypothetical protein
MKTSVLILSVLAGGGFAVFFVLQFFLEGYLDSAKVSAEGGQWWEPLTGLRPLPKKRLLTALGQRLYNVMLWGFVVFFSCALAAMFLAV